MSLTSSSAGIPRDLADKPLSEWTVDDFIARREYRNRDAERPPLSPRPTFAEQESMHTEVDGLAVELSLVPNPTDTPIVLTVSKANEPIEHEVVERVRALSREHVRRFADAKRRGVRLAAAPTYRAALRVATSAPVRVAAPKPAARESHRDRAGHRRTNSTRAGPDEDGEPEGGLCTCGCRPAKPIRYCACGCGREITHKRTDALTFGASCRQRVAREARRASCRPLEPRCCQCQSGFYYRDAEGDAICGLCGCWLAKVATKINGFDDADACMRSNGVYVRRRPIRREWLTRRKGAVTA